MNSRSERVLRWKASKEYVDSVELRVLRAEARAHEAEGALLRAKGAMAGLVEAARLTVKCGEESRKSGGCEDGDAWEAAAAALTTVDEEGLA